MNEQLRKEVKLLFAPHSPRTIPYTKGMTARLAIEGAGFEVKQSNAKQTVTYTIRVNNASNMGLDDIVPEPNGSTVTFLSITEDIKGN
jgi:hypothetical protein